MWNVIEIELGHHLMSALVEYAGCDCIAIIRSVSLLLVPNGNNLDVRTPSEFIQKRLDRLLNL